MTLLAYLENKPLFYDKIDYERMPRVWKKISHLFKLPKIIHLIGTNGKGTTGRFLATALHKNGYKTIHYTSPHIIKFNERISINGTDADDTILQNGHEKLQQILSSDDATALSYFEYTTLLAIVVSSDADFLVFEAGLGGERDATAVFENILTLVTPIGFDHEAFLGADIASIASTKLKAVQKQAIMASQPHYEVYEEAQKIGKPFIKIDELLTLDEKNEVKQIADSLALAPYLAQNLLLAVGALKFLHIDYKPDDFQDSKLFGRLSLIAPNILLDVGHNAMAAEKIKEALGEKRVTLIYNSYSDKNYTEILSILKPNIVEVQILNIQNPRIAPKEQIIEALESLNIKHSDFKMLDQNKKYLVFGSFSVAEEFLNGVINATSHTL